MLPWVSALLSPDTARIRSQLDRLKAVVHDSPGALSLAFVLGVATAMSAGRVHRRYFRRLQNGEWLTPDVLHGKRWIRGIVTKCVLCRCVEWGC
jgi:hypothetical protein